MLGSQGSSGSKEKSQELNRSLSSERNYSKQRAWMKSTGFLVLCGNLNRRGNSSYSHLMEFCRTESSEWQNSVSPACDRSIRSVYWFLVGPILLEPDPLGRFLSECRHI